MSETTAMPPPPETTSTPFVRPRTGRMLAGVCQGIADRWAIDVTLVRIVTVVLTLITGIGFAAYVATWLLTPSVDGPAPVQAAAANGLAQSASEQGQRLIRKLPQILLILLAALLILGITHWWWFGFGVPWGFGVPIGFLVVAALLVLAVATRLGRWLIAAVVALVVLALATFGIFGTHFGTRNYAVASVNQLQGSYKYGAGVVNLDLSGIQTIQGRHYTAVDLGRGNIHLTVPDGLPVLVHARSGVGSVTIDGHSVSGFDAEQTQALNTMTGAAPGELVVAARVGAGTITVTN